MGNALLGALDDEFEGADLGDPRLEERLLTLASALDDAPKASLAEASKSVAAREAAYRFVENHRVTMQAVMAPHGRKTAARCAAEGGAVFVVSDTTECTFKGDRRGEALGRVQGVQRGFLAHTAIAVSSQGNRKPLGVLGIDIIVRDDEHKNHRDVFARKRDPERESRKWPSMVDRTEELLAGVPAIHVMDREGDIFELLSELRAAGRRFVIRAAQDRWVQGEGRLFTAVVGAPVLLDREVTLSRRTKTLWTAKGRGHPRREERTAKLAISSRNVTLRRPKTTTADHPAELAVNVVNVHEPAPPDGEPPVQWLLLTSEAVDSAEQVAAVVDAYRTRWLIEEFFKALKTGCGFEARQLRTIRTLTNTLGILSVIAYRLLLLRWLERSDSGAPATTVLEPVLVEALAARLRYIKEPRPLPSNPTVADLMRGIARLGGHHKSN
ncbi:MAG TPA: IS4 family transposase, partial [Polyangia bacterium]|nr:IS4 family transposase [Polyangia bacterium]